MMTKKPYFPNNWKAYKESPDDMFFTHTFEEFMNWKLSDWELPSSVVCIIRENNNKTGKVKEHVYQRASAAKKKINNLMKEGIEFTVCDHDDLHHLSPQYIDEEPTE